MSNRWGLDRQEKPSVVLLAYELDKLGSY